MSEFYSFVNSDESPAEHNMRIFKEFDVILDDFIT